MHIHIGQKRAQSTNFSVGIMAAKSGKGQGWYSSLEKFIDLYRTTPLFFNLQYKDFDFGDIKCSKWEGGGKGDFRVWPDLFFSSAKYSLQQ